MLAQGWGGRAFFLTGEIFERERLGVWSSLLKWATTNMWPFYMPIFRLVMCKNTHSGYFKAWNKTVFYGREQGNVYKPVRFWSAKMSVLILSQGINTWTDNYLLSVGLEHVSSDRCLFNGYGLYFCLAVLGNSLQWSFYARRDVRQALIQ